ncbi:MAG: FAD-dependent oxidoreductase, partial [Alistipes sp.]|nr:FAD-dependent oxidoreductase [Alistipes sp.]
MIDLAIIGGGPAGYVAAERAGAAGLSVVLFEKNALGGVCLNEGCIPTKTLLYGAKTYENALSADKYGVSATDVSFDFGRMVARKNKVVRKLVLGVAAKMKAHGVEVVRGEATIAGREEGGFRISLGDGNGGASAASGSASASASAAAAAAAAMSGDGYVAKNLLICTGSEAFVPPIPGLAEGLGAPAADDAEGARGVMTAREILALKERPESLVIIGGGVIGMEFASLYNSLGTSVTVVEMLPEILGGMDSEIAATLREMYTKKGVAFRLGCRVVRIEGRDDDASRNGEGRRVVWTDAEGGESSADGDVVLVSIGRRPVTRGFGLENLGVELTRGGGIVVDQRMRTSVAGVWAAGDVTGFSMLAHTASRE